MAEQKEDERGCFIKKACIDMKTVLLRRWYLSCVKIILSTRDDYSFETKLLDRAFRDFRCR